MNTTADLCRCVVTSLAAGHRRQIQSAARCQCLTSAGESRECDLRPWLALDGCLRSL